MQLSSSMICDLQANWIIMIMMMMIICFCVGVKNDVVERPESYAN